MDRQCAGVVCLAWWVVGALELPHFAFGVLELGSDLGVSVYLFAFMTIWGFYHSVCWVNILYLEIYSRVIVWLFDMAILEMFI